MASTKSTAPKPNTQTKPKQSNEQWHEERYGEHRERLSDDCLIKIVEDICGKNYDSEAAAALVLLMDEFERSQFDTRAIQSIANAVSSSAYQYTDHRRSGEEKLILSMRKQFAAQEVCHA